MLLQKKLYALFFYVINNISVFKGRWDSTGQELLSLQDRHNREYVLSPVSIRCIITLICSNFFVPTAVAGKIVRVYYFCVSS